MTGTFGAPLKSILNQAPRFQNIDQQGDVVKGSEKETQLVVFDPGVTNVEETALEDNLKKLDAAAKEEYTITKDDSLALAYMGLVSRTRKHNQTKHGTSTKS